LLRLAHGRLPCLFKRLPKIGEGIDSATQAPGKLTVRTPFSGRWALNSMSSQTKDADTLAGKHSAGVH
jgi:hypothetical protein